MPRGVYPHKRGPRVPLAERFWAKVAKSDGCWLWTGASSRRYGHISTGTGGIERAHRVSWELAHGPVPAGMRVLHRCDVPLCVRPDHLFLGTQAENIADMVQKGRHRPIPRDHHPAHIVPGFRQGTRNGRSRLTPEAVREIRAMRASGVQFKDIAARFGVAIPTVQHIISGKNWAHVQ